MEQTHLPNACAVCNRLNTVKITERGPVKIELERIRIGHFLFCDDCLGKARQYIVAEGGFRLVYLEMLEGQFKGHKWITGIE